MPKVNRGSVQDRIIETVLHEGPISHNDLRFILNDVSSTIFETAVDSTIKKCIVSVDRLGRYYIK